MGKILITGGLGQVGMVLSKALKKKYGDNNVVVSDIHEKGASGVFELLDITDVERLREIVQKHKITTIFHLAAILSAKGEADPLWTWDLNMQGLFNVLELGKKKLVQKIFFPSSIAVFGKQSKLINAPQSSITDPVTVYGISKVSGEYWCQYYHNRYGVDVRSIRYPGLIGHQSLPGGGTTDYAVDIFHYAVKNEDYECFLKADSCLPMMYMPDAMRATIEVMEADVEAIKIRTSYNLNGFSFTPEELYQEIKKHKPDFKITYKPDSRQTIADSWPKTIDDTEAMIHWGWQSNFNIQEMVMDMLSNLKVKYINEPIKL